MCPLPCPLAVDHRHDGASADHYDIIARQHAVRIQSDNTAVEGGGGEGRDGNTPHRQ